MVQEQQPMNADLTAFYNLPDEERESIERQLNYIVWVYYGADRPGLQHFVNTAHDMGLYRHIPLLLDIAAMVIDMVAQED
jgi:hypothetical protein